MDQGIADHVVGYMVEGKYEWHEFCPDHVKVPLHCNPEAKVRSIDVFEASGSWRDYRCLACGRILWAHNKKEKAKA